jgi:hypothetical protein
MGSVSSPKAIKGSEVCHLMNVGKKKLVGVEVRVERDRLNGSVFSVAEVSQLGISWWFYKKIERTFFPKLNAVGDCVFWEVFLE